MALSRSVSMVSKDLPHLEDGAPGQARSGEGAYGDAQEAPTPGGGFVLDGTIQVTKASRGLWLQGEGGDDGDEGVGGSRVPKHTQCLPALPMSSSSAQEGPKRALTQKS